MRMLTAHEVQPAITVAALVPMSDFARRFARSMIVSAGPAAGHHARPARDSPEKNAPQRVSAGSFSTRIGGAAHHDQCTRSI
jgi:hypothetical protein